MSFTNYQELSAHLSRLGMFHMDLRLERMERGLRALQLDPPPYAVAHIVGTNGKGSTSTLLASLGKAHGLKTGLFTSPHMVGPRERILIDGRMLSEQRWVELGRRIVEAAPELTYFEFVCLAAALAFAEEGVAFAVFEAGLGGRFDATSALRAHLVCFTPIGRDHADVLGNSLRAIAGDKAAALRENTPALTANQNPEALSCLLKAARRLDVPLLRAPEICALPSGLKMRLRGPHQKENAVVALAAWLEMARQFDWPVRENAVRQGLESAFAPGRLQAIPACAAHPHLLLDGAHNAHAFLALRHALPRMDISPAAVIFSCLEDKEPESLAPLVLDLAMGAPLFIPPVANNARAAAPNAIAARLGRTAKPVTSLSDALKKVADLETTPQTPVLICGSLYLLGDFFALYPDYLGITE